MYESPKPFSYVSQHWDGATPLEVTAYILNGERHRAKEGEVGVSGGGEGEDGATSINLDLARGCLK